MNQYLKPVGQRWGEMGTKRDFAWGGGHTMKCADDVLLSCTLQTCLLSQTNVIPINSNFFLILKIPVVLKQYAFLRMHENMNVGSLA